MGSKVDLRIGRILVDQFGWKKSTISAAVARQTKDENPNPIGHYLRQLGPATAESDIEEALRIQSLERYPMEVVTQLGRTEEMDAPSKWSVTKPRLQNSDLFYGRLDWTAQQSDRASLVATLVFSQFDLPSDKPRYRIGLSRVVLRLKINSGSAPYRLRRFNTRMEASATVIRVVEDRRDSIRQTGSRTDIHAETSSGWGGGLGVAFGRAGEIRKGGSDSRTYKKIEHRISTGGSEQAPFWVFETLEEGEPLRNGLTGEELATILLHGIPMSISVQCIAASRDLVVDGVGFAHLSQLKRFVTKLRIGKTLQLSKPLLHQEMHCA